MADYQGFYYGFTESFRVNELVFPKRHAMRSFEWAAKYEEDYTIFMRAGYIYGLEIRTEKPNSKIEITVNCSLIGKAVIEYIEDMLNLIPADTYSNSKANEDEIITFYAPKNYFILNFKVFPNPGGICPMATFKNLYIYPPGSGNPPARAAFCDFNSAEVQIIGGGVSGSKVWVKIGGEWKTADVTVL